MLLPILGHYTPTKETTLIVRTFYRGFEIVTRAFMWTPQVTATRTACVIVGPTLAQVHEQIDRFYDNRSHVTGDGYRDTLVSERINMRSA